MLYSDAFVLFGRVGEVKEVGFLCVVAVQTEICIFDCIVACRGEWMKTKPANRPIKEKWRPCIEYCKYLYKIYKFECFASFGCNVCVSRSAGVGNAAILYGTCVLVFRGVIIVEFARHGAESKVRGVILTRRYCNSTAIVIAIRRAKHNKGVRQIQTPLLCVI